MKRIIVICILTILIINTYGQLPSYDSFIQHVNDLENSGNYEKASDYLNDYRKNYPEKYFELSKEEIYLNEKLQRYEDNLLIFKSGHQQGYFYFLHPELPKCKPYSTLYEFESISVTDLELREKALSGSETKYEIMLPARYSEDRFWPVCLIFHGGGSNLEAVKKHWHSAKLDSNFIKVYIQSYRHYDYNTFGWRPGDERADQDVTEIFRYLSEQYAVDTSLVLLAGISAGGTYATDLALRKIIPVRGTLTFCPGIPSSIEEEAKHTSGYLSFSAFIVGGENDYYLPSQKKMVELFSNIGVQFVFEVVAGMGHEYPDDEGHWIDEGIKFLLNNKF